MTTVRYLRASEWGMVWARPPYAEKMPDVECYIHHTAGGQLSSDGATAFRILNQYAIDVKGYSAMDYDVVVHYNPNTDVLTIGEGRGPWMSAATLDRNEQGEAICVLGYFHPGHALSRQPHPAEVEGVALAFKWGVENGWITQTAVILGHRDNPAHPGATGCPGDYLYAKLPQIRTRVAELFKEPDMVTRNEMLSSLFVQLAWTAQNPGGGAQGVLWDTVMPWELKVHFPAGHPYRSEFELAARSGNTQRLLAAWAAILAVIPV